MSLSLSTAITSRLMAISVDDDGVGSSHRSSSLLLLCFDTGTISSSAVRSSVRSTTVATRAAGAIVACAPVRVNVDRGDACTGIDDDDNELLDIVDDIDEAMDVMVDRMRCAKQIVHRFALALFSSLHSSHTHSSSTCDDSDGNGNERALLLLLL